MPSVKEVDQHQFVRSLAEFLKKHGGVKLPNNSDIIKLTRGNELAPYDPDWYYIRCASIMRHLYTRRTGLGGLRKVYGKKKRRGTKPARVIRANGGVLRECLSSMQKLEFVETLPAGGRGMTSKGRQLCDRIANKIIKLL